MLCIALTAFAFARTAPAPLSQREAEWAVYHSWREEAFEKNGTLRNSDECVKFSDTGPTYWGWRGELAPSSPEKLERITINPHVFPMELDFFSTDEDGTEWVRACIWKVQGDGDEAKFILVRPDRKERVRDDRDPQLRPTGFETTRENKWEKSLYVRCDYLEQDGSKRAKPDPKAKPPEKK